MAKKDETAAAENTEATTAAVEAPKTDARIKMVKVPATASHPYTVDSFKEALSGETVEQARAEFIREYALTNNYSRGELTSFTRLAAGDDSIKYQIIFQATKSISDKVSWPKKVEAAPAGEAAAADAGTEG